MFELRGAKSEVEIAIRRTARALQLAFVLPPTLLLWWLDLQWWVPVPLALSFVVHDALLRPYRDDALRLWFDEDGIRLLDPLGEGVLVLWSEIELANVFHRRLGDRFEIALLFASPSGPRLAIRLVLGEQVAVEEGDIDLDAAERTLGSQGGVIRSLAPDEVVARQHFEDARPLAFSRSMLPADIWCRTGVMLWTGSSPPLDTAGYHRGPPDLWLVLDGPRFELRQYGTAAVLESGIFEQIELFSAIRPLDIAVSSVRTLETTVAMLGIGIGTVRVWFPAPHTAVSARQVTIDATDHHTHSTQGAALIAHLQRERPQLFAETDAQLSR